VPLLLRALPVHRKNGKRVFNNGVRPASPNVPFRTSFLSIFLLLLDKRQEKAKVDTHTSGGGNDMAVDASSPPPPGSLSASVSIQSSSMLPPGDDDGDVDQDQERPSAVTSVGNARDSNPPPKRYKLTDEMKVLLWQIVALSNECCKLENEKKWVSFRFDVFVRIEITILMNDG
jgi:hypothetical protein